jgi:hypothetical protein
MHHVSLQSSQSVGLQLDGGYHTMMFRLVSYAVLKLAAALFSRGRDKILTSTGCTTCNGIWRWAMFATG